MLASPYFEERLRSVGFDRVAGVDEAGRGALAGPLVAAAVVLPRECAIEGLADSKLLTPTAREAIAAQVRQVAVAWAVVRVGPDRIDRQGLHRTNLALLGRALRALAGGFDYALADGFPIGGLPAPVLGVRKGDQLISCIAAASVLAKVSRDRMMCRAAKRFPGYGFERHKGYGTDAHWAALRALGPSSFHRRSFNGVVDPWGALERWRWAHQGADPSPRRRPGTATLGRGSAGTGAGGGG